MGQNKSKPKSKSYKHDKFVERNVNFSNWMGDMSEYIKDTRLVDLRLIRSHQSATFNIDTFLDNSSICQHNSIYYQLIGGVRVLDIRPGRYDKEHEIICGHGPHRAIEIIQIFEAVKDFLSEHPKEFIIIEMETAPRFFGINHELNPIKKIELIKMINRIFGDLLIRGTDDWFDLKKVTMNDIWQHKKQILVISHSFIINWKENNLVHNVNNSNHHINHHLHFHHTKNNPKKLTLEEAKNLGIFDMFSIVYGRFANTNDKLFMKKHVIKVIENSQDEMNENYNKFQSVNLQLTPQTITNIFNMSTVLHHEEFLHKFLNDYFKLNKRLNIIAFDFCFYNPQLVRDIIYSNFYYSQFFMKFGMEKMNLKYINFNEENITNDEINVNLNFLDTIIYHKDIFKLKFLHSHHYLTVSKFGNVLTSKSIKKIYRNLFQIEIVDPLENIVRFKSCYFSSKGICKDFYLFIDENKFDVILKEYHTINNLQGSLFKLKFLKNYSVNNIIYYRISFIEFVTTCANEKNKYLSINTKNKLCLSNVHSDDKNKLIYLEK